MSIRRVLLVCSGNTCRSPMAAALLRRAWQQSGPQESLEVASAGASSFPGLAAADHAMTVMQARGLDLSGHRSQELSDQVLQGVDLVLTMTVRHKEHILRLWPSMQGKVHTLGEYAQTGREIMDPFGGSRDQYEAAARELEQAMAAVVDRLRRKGKA